MLWRPMALCQLRFWVVLSILRSEIFLICGVLSVNCPVNTWTPNCQTRAAFEGGKLVRDINNKEIYEIPRLM